MSRNHKTFSNTIRIAKLFKRNKRIPHELSIKKRKKKNKTKMTLNDTTPYSPDYAPRNFFLFSKIKKKQWKKKEEPLKKSNEISNGAERFTTIYVSEMFWRLK